MKSEERSSEDCYNNAGFRGMGIKYIVQDGTHALVKKVAYLCRSDGIGPSHQNITLYQVS